MDVLGYVDNLERMTASFPPAKAGKLHRVLEEWPPTRRTTTVKQIVSLTTFCLCGVCHARRESFCCTSAGFVFGIKLSPEGWTRIVFLPALDTPSACDAIPPQVFADLEV